MTMKKVFVLFFVFLPIFANCQVHCDTLNINAKVITGLNKPLATAIDRHIEVSRAKKHSNNNDYFVIVLISPGITKWQIPKRIFDSIYSFNDLKTVFPKDTVLPEYNISIVLSSKLFHTEGWISLNKKNIYYCKYHNYDVLINSDMDLIFENEHQTLQLVTGLIDPEKPEKNFPFKIWTRYSMWNNRYLTEIRYKDLISPDWTGKHDEFE